MEEGGYDLETMPGLDKAAIFCNAIGVKVTKEIFKHLSDNDLKRMLPAMQRMQKVPIDIMKEVMEFFYKAIAEEEFLLFSKVSGRDFILETVGEERANAVLGTAALSGEARTLEALELVDTRTLSNFLLGEHPQTIALIMAHLDAKRKCEAIKKLPENIQSEVVLRIAHLDFIAPELITTVDKILKQELAQLGSLDTHKLGGIDPIAEMLNVMDKTNEQAIMARVEEKDPALSEEIRNRMFVFEDLVYCDDKGLGTLLKEVAPEKLTVALKTASEAVKAKIFKNMSNRATQMLKEELESMGPVRVSDVDTAQSEIVANARKLEAEGKLIVARGGGDDQLV